VFTWFVHVPWAPTLEGQHITRNLVLIRAAIVIGGTVGGRLSVTPPMSKASHESSSRFAANCSRAAAMP
jgi:hypothetical protein